MPKQISDDQIFDLKRQALHNERQSTKGSYSSVASYYQGKAEGIKYVLDLLGIKISEEEKEALTFGLED